MSRTIIDVPSELFALVGQELGTSPWLEVTQSDVDDFARVTRDDQWIHVDPERAARGPFGGTIAHGFFVLSLCAHFSESTLEIRSQQLSINYGLDRVRFMSPVPVGSRIRAHVELASAREIENGVHYTAALTIEIDGGDKPACVAVLVGRVLDGPASADSA